MFKIQNIQLHGKDIEMTEELKDWQLDLPKKTLTLILKSLMIQLCNGLISLNLTLIKGEKLKCLMS